MPTIYLLHIERPHRRPTHYLGGTTQELTEHLIGPSRSLVGPYRVVRIWPVDGRDEAIRLGKSLAKWKSVGRYCLLCRGRKAKFQPVRGPLMPIVHFYQCSNCKTTMTSPVKDRYKCKLCHTPMRYMWPDYVRLEQKEIVWNPRHAGPPK